MSYGVPDVEEVVSVARSLGIHLGADEALLYRKYLLEHLKALDEFVQSRIEEPTPPMRSALRQPGWKPSLAEDPLNAWMWRCEIPGDPDGILAGKTVSFKDHIAVAGVPMSFGSFALDGFVPDFDATVVTRVLEAGGTVVGKHVMDGLSGGFSMGGGIGDYGRPLNPHNLEHVTGGSSSGSGAALASGQVDISFGGDQGGSIRIPAAFCGTLGLKPTFGLVSHFGIGSGSDQRIDYTGPMARTVEDAAAALEATAGYDGYDPRQSRLVPERLDVVSGLDNGIAGLRIGILEEGFDDADREVKDLVLAAVEVLDQAGAQIVRVSVPEHHQVRAAQQALSGEGALAVFNSGFYGAFTRTYYPPSLLAAINQLWLSHADNLSPRTRLSLIGASMSRRNYNGRMYAKAQNVRPTFIKAYDTALLDVDVLVMPTCLMTAPKNHHPDSYMQALEENLSMRNARVTKNTQPFNYTGHPALAIPVGKSAAGLPASMQLIGRFFDDPLLLRVGYAYQHSTDWESLIGIGTRERERIPV